MKRVFSVFLICVFFLSISSVPVIAFDSCRYGVVTADGHLLVLGKVASNKKQSVSMVIRSDGGQQPLTIAAGVAYMDQQRTDANGWFCFKVKLDNFNQSDVINIYIESAISSCYAEGKTVNISEVISIQEVNAMEFGADNTGRVDNTFLLSLLHETGKRVYYPTGTYIFNGENLNLTGGIRFESRHAVKIRNSISSVPIINFDDNGNLIGLMQNHLEKTYDDLDGQKNTIGSLVNPPLSTANYQTKVDFIPYWYNDFGLESTRQGTYSSKLWYDWRWNHHSNSGSDPKTAYDSERQPLMGFYRGDDPVVLDWQCYWMKEYGTKAVVLYSARKKVAITQNWDSSSSPDHWIYQLFHNVPNFNVLEYIMTLSADYTPIDGATEEDRNTVRQTWYKTIDDIYGVYQNPYCIVENGKRYPVIYVHEESAIFGVFDNYSGSSNTLNFYKTIVNKMKSFGYDGVALFVRNDPGLSKSVEQAFENAGIKRLQVKYSPHYVDTKGETADYKHMVESFNPPTDKKNIVNTFTSRYTHSPHPTAWNTPGHTPALFNQLMNKAVDHVYRNNMTKIITCYNVAEWAEGGPGLQPNVKNGFGYLQAVKDAIVLNDTGDVALNITYIDDNSNVITGGNAIPTQSDILIRCNLYSNRPLSGHFVVAMYVGDKLRGIKLYPITGAAGTLQWEIPLQARQLNEISHIKTFLLGGMENLEPLVKGQSFPEK